MKKHTGIKITGFVLLGILIAAAVFFAVGHLVVYLWGYTLVALLGVKQISFLQAWALMVLCWILFKANIHSEHHSHGKPGFIKKHFTKQESQPAPQSDTDQA
jgi:hypothetical protein